MRDRRSSADEDELDVPLDKRRQHAAERGHLFALAASPARRNSRISANDVHGPP